MHPQLKNLVNLDFSALGNTVDWNSIWIQLRFAADALLIFSSLLIVILILYFLRARADLRHRSPLVFFAFAFIFMAAASLAHLFKGWSQIEGAGIFYLFASALSFVLASFSLWKVIPKTLTLPHPSISKILEVLEIQAEEYRQKEEQLRQARGSLESTIENRTSELKQANQALERQNAEIKFLPFMMQSINECDDFFSALEVSLEAIGNLTGWPYGEVWLPREDKKILECSHVWYGAEKFKTFHESSQELKFLPDMGLPGKVWSTKQTCWIPDLAAKTHVDSMRGPLCQAAGMKAGVGVPILEGNGVLAVLVFYLTEARQEDEHLINLVSTVASQLGAVLQRKKAQHALARAYEDLEKRVKERTEELVEANDALQKQIIEREKIEKALRDSKQNYQTLVHSAEGILWEFDLNQNRFTFVSQQAQEILGYPVQLWLQDAGFWLEHVHGEEREAILACREKVVSQKQNGECEYRMITSGGENIWFRDSVRLVLDEGRPVKLRGMMVDITKRKKSEEAWQDERNFVAAVLDTASAVVMILDGNGNIIRVNRACEKISGYPEKEMIGKCFWESSLVSEEVENMKTIFKRLFAGQFPANYESSWVAKDGTRRVIAWSSTMLTSKEKGTQHVIATGIDITNRKEIEQKLQTAATDLASTNKDLDRYSEDLKEANQRLKKMDGLKSEFISMASHELRTPLTSIKGYVEMVYNGEAGPLNVEQKEFLGHVKSSTDRLARLLRELLDISKIESGRATMNREFTDLKVLIKEEQTLFKAHAQEKNTQLLIDVDPDLKNIYCDSDKIREVLDNLLSNAIKYTPQQGEIKIFARNHDLGVLIGVQDNGIGIKKEEHGRIFEPFQHLNKAGTEPDEESTGLGLTLVERIVGAHGGKIQVQSDEGKGSLFTVILPLEMKQSKLNEVIGNKT